MDVMKIASKVLKAIGNVELNYFDDLVHVV